MGREEDDTLLPDGRRLVLRRWDMSRGTYPEVLLVVRTCESWRISLSKRDGARVMPAGTCPRAKPRSGFFDLFGLVR